MADRVIFSQPYATVLVDASVPCVTVQWHAFANTTEFIAAQEAALRYLETHSTPARPWGIVGDVRNMGAIPDKVQQWLQAEFNPRVTAAGVHELHVVLATNIFGQLATQRYAQATREAQHELRTTFFDSLDTAKTELRRALVVR